MFVIQENMENNDFFKTQPKMIGYLVGYLAKYYVFLLEIMGSYLLPDWRYMILYSVQWGVLLL